MLRVKPMRARRTLRHLVTWLALAWLSGGEAHALGPEGAIEVRRVLTGEASSAHAQRAAERLSWEIRKRTSIETALAPTEARFDDPSIFRTPLLYWSGERPFPPLSDRELSGLRRFVEYGGFIVIDDPSAEPGGFEASVRRELARAFPSERLERLPAAHTIFRSFYLLEGGGALDGLTHAGRVAVVYARRDLGSAWATDTTGERPFGRADLGSDEREFAVRLGVNLVMYALCLDYKDDQVHAPFILRRRAGRP
jgi:hypothetical protein